MLALLTVYQLMLAITSLSVHFHKQLFRQLTLIKNKNSVVLFLDTNEYKRVSFLNKNEFFYKRNMYDIVSIKQLKNAVKIVAVKDTEELELLKWIHYLVHSITQFYFKLIQLFHSFVHDIFGTLCLTKQFFMRLKHIAVYTAMYDKMVLQLLFRPPCIE